MKDLAERLFEYQWEGRDGLQVKAGGAIRMTGTVPPAVLLGIEKRSCFIGFL